MVNISHTALITGLFLVVFGASSAAYAAPTELHIRPDGTMIANNIIIKQKSGGNLFARMVWGESSYARLVVVTQSTTVIKKAYGELATVADLQEGDTIDVEGKLLGADGSISIQATAIRDHSLLKEGKNISGNVKSINSGQSSFVLPNKGFGDTVVTVSPTTTIQKGARTILFADVAVGDKILAAQGTYNYTNNTLAATRLEVHQDAAMFTARNFQGTLKSIASAVLPTTMVITVGTTDYTVYLNEKAAVLNTAKAPTSLSRFVLGDTVRFYGAIRKTNFSEIDAEVVRDINF
ncbi:MAG: hypothetical protein HYT30_01835 [Parcubacteria group bacterium]|nr:hypothetical protein [Parcubacteria group bacterium]